MGRRSRKGFTVNEEQQEWGTHSEGGAAGGGCLQVGRSSRRGYSQLGRSSRRGLLTGREE
jgi:hypothetical protein